MYNRIFVCYAQRSHEWASRLANGLSEYGFELLNPQLASTQDSNSLIFDWAEATATAIRYSDYFVIVVDENFINSKYAIREASYALRVAADSLVSVIPLYLVEPNSLKASLRIELDMHYGPTLSPDDALAAQEAADFILSLKNTQIDKDLITSRIAERISAPDYSDPTFLCLDLCALFQIQREELSRTSNLFAVPSSKRKKYWNLYNCVERIGGCFTSYCEDQIDEEGAEAAIAVANDILTLLNNSEFQTDDSYYLSLAIRLAYYEALIRYRCAQVYTNGDITITSVTVRDSIRSKIEKQNLLIKRFEAAASKHADDEAELYLPRELEFINSEYLLIESLLSSPSPKPTRLATVDESERAEEEVEYLASIMEGTVYLQSLAKVLYDAFLPLCEMPYFQQSIQSQQCLKLAIGRLKEYSRIIDEKDIYEKCIDRICEIEQRLQSELMRDGEPVEEIDQLAIHALLGLTQPNSERYDVFLSFHSRELGRRVYQLLKEHLFHVFFSEESHGSNYRKEIYRAIDCSNNFIVVLSSFDDLTDWVVEEMELFHGEIASGRKPGAGFYIVALDTLASELGTNKTLLPIQCRNYKILKPVQLEEYIPNLRGQRGVDERK